MLVDSWKRSYSQAELTWCCHHQGPGSTPGRGANRFGSVNVWEILEQSQTRQHEGVKSLDLGSNPNQPTL